MQLSVLVKPASGLCNMACRYCFYREEMEKRKGSPPSFMDETTLELCLSGRRTYALWAGFFQACSWTGNKI